MSGRGGQELYGRIMTELPLFADSIIFITGDIANPATKKFLTEVGNPALSKPFDFRELEQLVLSITNRPKNVGNLPVHRFDPGLPAST